MALLGRQVTSQASGGTAFDGQFGDDFELAAADGLLRDTRGGAQADLRRTDLDFFEGDPKVRKEDASYYGHKRAEEEIRSAPRKLKQLGIEMPEDLDLSAGL